MEFRVTVTIAEHGHDPENGLRFLKGFRETHPETGPVVDQNVETGRLAVTYSFDANDLLDAMSIGPRIFVEGATASGLPATALTDFAVAAEVQITAVSGDPATADDRLLQPA